MKKKVVITGITGMDASLLAKLLLEKGYEVVGTYRRISTPNFWRIQQLGIIDDIILEPMDLMDGASILRVVKKHMPDEFYNLAAQSHVGASFEQPLSTGEITGLGVTRILEVLREIKPDTKFYQASTSELFGEVLQTPQNELTPFNPRSPYAAAKAYAHYVTVNYREAYGMFACTGILFNHESSIRGLEFVTRKITNAAARIKLGLQDTVRLGNLDARRDWGYAPEFVEAQWMILQQEVPGDYVIATGETHTVREFVMHAFEEVGIHLKSNGLSGVDEKLLDSKGNIVVEVDPEFFRPSEVDLLLGDPSKARKELGWQPRVKFAELVRLMVKADLERWQLSLAGEHFAWDATNDVDWRAKKPATWRLDR